jgi:hypothetical protein
MKNVTRLMGLLVLALTISFASPAAGSASTCTSGFSRCLNDTWDAISRPMADFECTAGWAGCVMGKLKFW